MTAALAAGALCLALTGLLMAAKPYGLVQDALLLACTAAGVFAVGAALLHALPG